MSEASIKFIAAAFKSEEQAGKELEYLREGERDRMIGLKNAAIIRKDTSGKLHISETEDMGAGKGAVIGGALGTALGLLTGPGAILVGAAGAALVGGLAAKLHDAGISNKALKEFGDSLQPGTSALILVLADEFVEQISADLTASGAQVITESLDPTLAAEIEKAIADHWKDEKALRQDQEIAVKVAEERYEDKLNVKDEEQRPTVL